MSLEAPLWWDAGALCLLDQTALPREVRTRRCTTWADVAEAIRALRVRGAPAIGVAAAYGMVLAAQAAATAPEREARRMIREAAAGLRGTRPTAVNLGWAIGRMLEVAEATLGPAAPPAEGDRDRPSAPLAARLLVTAHALAAADLDANRRMAAHGAALMPAGARILTYCNTGMLATSGYGTAFGVLRRAHDLGRRIEVVACETRPALQGARLTMWELERAGIPATLITDNAAGALMRNGEVDVVAVGADRIAANGDVANKIGTYSLGVLARAHEIPFYVVAPLSTVDPATGCGAEIPIEERRPEEVAEVGGVRVAPPGIRIRNPAFDVTPHHLVTAIVTEAGVLEAPYDSALRAALSSSPSHVFPPSRPPRAPSGR